MQILKYLNENGLDAEVMMSKFGVKVVCGEGMDHGLFQLKYTQWAARWSEPIVHECRGVIVQRVDSGWLALSRPFDKFFNFQDPRCPLRPDTAVDGLVLAEKADGTCIQVWYDYRTMSWRASTLGTISPTALNGKGDTFDQMFWDTSGHLFAVLVTACKSWAAEWTWLFELCTPHNRIVTRYEQPHVVLLGCRHIETGDYMSAERMSALVEDYFNDGSVRRPWLHRCGDIGLRSHSDIIEFVEQEAMNPLYGEWPEGFVAYQDGRPVAKLKNKRYLQLHAVGGGDIRAARHKVEEAFFTGTLDDIEETLNDELAQHVSNLRASVSSMSSSVDSCMKAVESRGPFESRKEYAIAVQNSVHPPYQAFAYQRGASGDLSFESWLCSNYAKFQATWDDLGATGDDV